MLHAQKPSTISAIRHAHYRTGGSLTEIVYALQRRKMLAARDQTSAYPDAVKKPPDIGYMRQLAPEGVLSVNPTGILLLEGSGPQDTLDVLKKASVP